ncbi:leucyl aminopeptidase [Brooklawnia sp.]|uniref:leucyl aminopeptidase family protein n=1 Tax=Brooklawnia sp. TaxID=2699740 RepID=UPI00311D8528
MTHKAPYPAFELPQRDLKVSAVELVSQATALGIVVFEGEEPDGGLSAARAAELGFSPKPGATLVLAGTQTPVTVLLGAGERSGVDLTTMRDLAAALARAVPAHRALGLKVPDTDLCEADIATAFVEGAALARYVFRLGAEADDARLDSLELVADAALVPELGEGIERGKIIVQAAKLGRDLAGTPGGLLTPTRMAQVALEVGAASGLEVQIIDEAGLVEMGCGGLLGVNLGSVEPPVMVKLIYRPVGTPTGRLALVGKGITYDAGGLALKPGDEMHATMKNDMTGAGALFAAMTTLKDLGCQAEVIGYMMCTDNMPSGSALRLGDIIVMRNGKTVEVINTDAEGRLVMADALVLATEDDADAIVDIATLTGAAMRALGVEIAAVLGNDQQLLGQVKAAAERVDEPVWELPLAQRYRHELNSPIADLRNVGGINAGSITAALFLEEFVAGKPWAHIDIAGTAQSVAAKKWLNQGPTGFGTRLLIDLALNFKA